MPSPEPNSLHSLASQVGGHPGVMTNEEGSVIVKTTSATEIEFYQTVHTHSAFEPLRPYVPTFLGTLKLQGQIDPEKSQGGAIVVKEETKVEGSEKDKYNCYHRRIAFRAYRLLRIHIR